MKKAVAILAILVMLFTAAAFAEETTAPTFTGGVSFNMDMDQVMEILNLPNPEIDGPEMRGPTEFYELEYEHVVGGDGFTADVTYLFVGNSLVAVHMDMADGTSYEAVKEELVGMYGEALPFDAAKLGNARYVIDDDGDLKDCREMFELEAMTIVLCRDDDGDVEVFLLDPTAAYINN